jgi:hypothetical protein
MLLLAVAVNPNFGVEHGNLAILYAMMGQNDQAKANLKRVVELGVRNPMTENLQRILQNPPPEVIK